jgi:hypothetical protein
MNEKTKDIVVLMYARRNNKVLDRNKADLDIPRLPSAGIFPAVEQGQKKRGGSKTRLFNKNQNS